MIVFALYFYTVVVVIAVAATLVIDEQEKLNMSTPEILTLAFFWPLSILIIIVWGLLLLYKRVSRFVKRGHDKQ